MTKSFSSPMSFCSPSYFPANDCCFACVSFHVPTLPFPPAFPSIPHTFHFVPHFLSQTLVEHARCRSFLQRTSFHIFLLFPLMYFHSLLHFLIPYFPSFPYFSCLSRTFLTKILFRMPAPCPSPAYFLPFALPSCTFLYCGFYLYCVCNVFFFPFCFAGTFLKDVFILDDLFFFIDLVLVYLML